MQPNFTPATFSRPLSSSKVCLFSSSNNSVVVSQPSRVSFSWIRNGFWNEFHGLRLWLSWYIFFQGIGTNWDKKVKQVSKCDFNIETDLPPGLTKARPVQSFDFLIPQEEPPVRYEEDLQNDETNPVGRFGIASRRVVPRGLCLWVYLFIVASWRPSWANNENRVWVNIFHCSQS